MTEAIVAEMVPRLSELVAELTGLHFPPHRHAELLRAVARAAEESGHGSINAYVRTLLDQPRRTNSQIQALAWHLTVGETYFLRGEQTFETLQSDVLPELIGKRANGDRRLRIWSAGCSCGEEPYSLAITLRRLLPDIEDWAITILATDLNTRSLQKAQTGVYGDWSFRSTPDWLRPRFFSPARGGQWEINPAIRQMVTFSYLNLATGQYPSPATNTQAMDVIFCRNVLMYFTDETMRKVISGLYSALNEGGYLFVAPGEASNDLFSQFKRVVYGGETFYRRITVPQDEPVPVRARPTRVVGGATTKTKAAAVRARRRPPAQQKPAKAVPAQPAAASAAHAGAPGDDARSAVESAILFADAGNLTEALRRCEQAISANKTAPEYRYLQATILDELKRDGDAVRALNSAIYLSPDFVLAHFLLGNIARRKARRAEAERHYRRTLELLDAQDPTAELPGSDGLQSGRLAEVVRALLQPAGGF
jgi:chemotaxis protein methyltransferase CheR